MQYRFKFRPYKRRFKPPLQTSHGIWDVREGIILCLTDETGKQDLRTDYEKLPQNRFNEPQRRSGKSERRFPPNRTFQEREHREIRGECVSPSKVSWGEIAPISWFGSETLQQALDFCRQLPDEITDETIFSIPDKLPACQFGFESAWEAGDKKQEIIDSGCLLSIPALTYCGLLPAGKAALEQSQKLWNQGYRTFKWKIGVYPIADEIEIFNLLTQTLPASAKLRLDANGGLNYNQANLWLWTCDNIRANAQLTVEIEFIEQPLPIEQFEEMQELSYCYATVIALDESVATLTQMEFCYQQGWRGIFVIKPCIAGSPKRLRQFCHQNKITAVFSSVFETSVGRQAALNLAAELSHHNMAVGFGINHWFDDDNKTWLEYLWNDL